MLFLGILHTQLFFLYIWIYQLVPVSSCFFSSAVPTTIMSMSRHIIVEPCQIQSYFCSIFFSIRISKCLMMLIEVIMHLPKLILCCSSFGRFSYVLRV